MRLKGYRIGVAAAAALVPLAIACLPHPKEDFDDFVARTANLTPDAAKPVVDANIDSKPPEEAVESLYVGICVTKLANGDPEQALRFYTKTKYVPGTPDGTLSISVTPLRGWENGQYIQPSTVSMAETRGDATNGPPGPVASDGRFTQNLGTIRLPEAANSISGRAAVIDNATLDGRFGDADRFCSTLGGQLVQPYQYTFDPAQNTCLFQKVKDGDPLPKIPAAEFVCPL
jgi:hypothetical protein